MILTYRYRLKGGRIGGRLSAHARSVNTVWNYCVGIQKKTQENWKRGVSYPWLSHFDFNGLTTGVSKQLELNAQTIGEVNKQFVKSRDQHKKCPKIRKSFGPRRSLGWIPFHKQGRQITSDSITYMGNAYKLFGTKNRPLPDVVKGGCFVEDSRGRWYVCLQVEVKEDNNHGTKQIGVDLGLKDLVTTSDGEKYENPAYYRKSEQKLKVAQRANNKKQVRNIHTKIKNQRNDYNHKLSSQLIKDSSLIIVGNVSAAKLAKTRMAKSIHDAGWSALREMLRYKASRHGVKYLEVNEHFTTQTCSQCGQRPPERPKGIAGLGIREWTCSLCGSTHDRDVNAAKNILYLGRGAPPPVEESQGNLYTKVACYIRRVQNSEDASTRITDSPSKSGRNKTKSVANRSRKKSSR